MAIRTGYPINGSDSDLLIGHNSTVLFSKYGTNTESGIVTVLDVPLVVRGFDFPAGTAIEVYNVGGEQGTLESLFVYSGVALTLEENTNPIILGIAGRYRLKVIGVRTGLTVTVGEWPNAPLRRLGVIKQPYSAQVQRPNALFDTASVSQWSTIVDVLNVPIVISAFGIGVNSVEVFIVHGANGDDATPYTTRGAQLVLDDENNPIVLPATGRYRLRLTGGVGTTYVTQHPTAIEYGDPYVFSGGRVQSVNSGPGITVNNTDPDNPIVGLSSSSQVALGQAATSLQPNDNISELNNDAGYLEGVEAGTNISIDTTDPLHPIISTTGGSGSVTSVALSVPTGLLVAGSPITTSGTLAVAYAAGYKGYTNVEANKLAGIEAGAQVNTVDSVNTQTGDVTLNAGDVGAEPAFAKGSLIQGANVTLTGTLANRLVGAGNVTIAATGGGTGTVTSVAVSGTDGVEVDSGSPITTAGTIQLGLSTTVLGQLADAAAAVQPGDNVSTLANDAGYVDAAGAATAAPVQSVNGDTGVVVLSAADVGAEPAFTKGNLVAGTNVTLTGTLTGRLVGTGNVTIAASGGGGAAWGGITGTLSAQTDLQAALDAKVATTALAADSGAAFVGYDNATSGLTATDVQGAIDELETLIVGGSGDVVGPASSIMGNFALFGDSTGKLIADGGVPGDMAFIDDAPNNTTGYVRKGGAWQAESSGGADRSTVTALGIVSGVVNVDWALGDFFTLALTANVISITHSNLPAAGKAASIAVRIRQDATGGRTITFPSAFKATGGSDTIVQVAPNSYTLLTLTTFDQGTRFEYAMQEIAT